MDEEVRKAYTKKQLQQFDKWWQQISKKVEISDVTGPSKSWPAKLEDLPRFPVGFWPATKEQVEKIMDKLVKLALDLGATDAKAIYTRDIPQDIRSLYIGCLYPSCRWLNTNIFCPLKAKFPFEEMEELVKHDYDNAIVFKMIPTELDGIPDVGNIDLDVYYTGGGQAPPEKAILIRNIVRLRILEEITRRIRQVAFYSGCIAALPIGIGPCIVSKCASNKMCAALRPTGICPFRGMSANGPVLYIDYHTLGRNLGWGQLQIGGNCSLFPEEVPDPKRYYNIGLVLID